MKCIVLQVVPYAPIFHVNGVTIPRPQQNRRPPTESSAHAASLIGSEMSRDLRKRSLTAVLQEKVVRICDLFWETGRLQQNYRDV